MSSFDEFKRAEIAHSNFSFRKRDTFDSTSRKIAEIQLVAGGHNAHLGVTLTSDPYPEANEFMKCSHFLTLNDTSSIGGTMKIKWVSIKHVYRYKNYRGTGLYDSLNSGIVVWSSVCYLIYMNDVLFGSKRQTRDKNKLHTFFTIEYFKIWIRHILFIEIKQIHVTVRSVYILAFVFYWTFK